MEKLLDSRSLHVILDGDEHVFSNIKERDPLYAQILQIIETDSPSSSSGELYSPLEMAMKTRKSKHLSAYMEFHIVVHAP